MKNVLWKGNIYGHSKENFKCQQISHNWKSYILCNTVIINNNFWVWLILHDTQLDLNLIHLIWPSMFMYLSRLLIKNNKFTPVISNNSFFDWQSTCYQESFQNTEINLVHYYWYLIIITFNWYFTGILWKKIVSVYGNAKKETKYACIHL